MIPIVTAFYDIGRGQWMNYLNRTVDTYFERFEMLCILENPIYCYSDIQFKDRFDRLKKIKPNLEVRYYDPFQDTHLMNKVKEVQMGAFYQENCRYPDRAEAMSWRYGYVTCLKPHIVSDAIKYFKLKGNVSWIDFGYPRELRHIPSCRKWDYDFPKLINVWTHTQFDYVPWPDMNDNQSIIDFVLAGEAKIATGCIVAPVHLWHWLKFSFTYEMYRMLILKVFDDDQTPMVFSLLENPSKYSLHVINADEYGWFHHLNNYNSIKNPQ